MTGRHTHTHTHARPRAHRDNERSRECDPAEERAVDGHIKFGGTKALREVQFIKATEKEDRIYQVKEADGNKRNIFSSTGYGGRVHMDLVDLYLPECFSFHSDTE